MRTMIEKNRFTRAEYLIFKYVDDYGVPIRRLVDPDLSEALNLPGHGLSRGEVVALVYKMFEGHYLVAFTEKRGYFTPTLTEFEKALSEPTIDDPAHDYENETLYCLTSLAIESYRELADVYSNIDC